MDSYDRDWLKIARLGLRIARKEGKKAFKPAQSFLRSQIKRRKGWGEHGDPPAFRTKKRWTRRHIQTRVKFQKKETARQALGLTKTQYPFIKLKSWTPIANLLADTHGWSYRALPFSEAEKLINFPLLLDKITTGIEPKVTKLTEDAIGKEVLQPLADGLTFSNEGGISMETTLEK